MTRTVKYFYLCLGLFSFALMASDLTYRLKSIRHGSYSDTHSVGGLYSGGVDFKPGFNRAFAFRTQGVPGYLKVNQDPYPPSMTFLYYPFSFASERTGYLCFVGFLYLSMFLTVFFILKINLRGPTSALAWPTSMLLCYILSHTHAFSFSFERGNHDIVIGLLITLFLIFLFLNRRLLAAVFFILACQKLFPVLLGVLYFLKAGLVWSVLSLIAAVALMGVFGADAFHQFLKMLNGFGVDPIVWDGNHSLTSWSIFFSEYHLTRYPQIQIWILSLFLVLPLGVFIQYYLKMYARDFSQKGLKQLLFGANSLQGNSFDQSLPELALLGVSVALMGLLTPTSHDYRLVIQVIPFLLLFSDQVTLEKLLHLRTGKSLFVLLSLALGLLFGPRVAENPKTFFLIAACVFYGAIALLAIKIEKTALE